MSAAVIVRSTRPQVDAIVPEAADQLARWLLLAVAADLVLTRFVVRLAIFVPKDGPLATAAAALGRVGAAADVLVPILGALLLGALLVRAGRAGGWAERATLVAVAMIAAGGVALVVAPPVPSIVVALGLLIGVVAVVSGVRLLANRAIGLPARLGLAALAASTAVAAMTPTLGAAGTLDGPGRAAELTIAGQAAFVAGGALVGLGGLLAARRQRSRVPLSTMSIAIAAAVALAVAGATAPTMFGAIAIWSVGLTGAVPPPAIAAALGLVLMGLPLLHRQAPRAATGGAIVLLAGFGLAASGLILAGLLGLLVAAGSVHGLADARPTDDKSGQTEGVPT